MTVKKLMEKLKEMPEDAEVVIVHNDWCIKKIEIGIDTKIIKIS